MRKANVEKRMFSCRVPADLYAVMSEAAERENRSLNNLIEVALRQYLGCSKPKKKYSAQ